MARGRNPNTDIARKLAASGLDYVFVPGAFAERLLECEVLSGPEAIAASDHFPLLAVIDV